MENPQKPVKTIGPWGCLSVMTAGFFLFLTVTVVTVILCGSAVLSGFGTGASGDGIERETLCGDPDSPSAVAVIDITGVIASEPDGMETTVSPETVCRLLDAASADPDVKAVLLRMNTPGGEVTASDIISHAVKTCEKPVVVLMDALAASGGYYIAASADRILANRNTLTGSIGVIITSINYAGLSEKIGVRADLYTSGPMKAMLSGNREPDAETKQLVRDIVMDSYRTFVQVVSEGRNIPEETLLKSKITDGRILTAAEALEAGLIDGLGYFEDAVAEAEKLASIPPGTAHVVLYTEQQGLMDMLLKGSAGLKKPTMSIQLPGTAASSGFRMKPGRAYYLPFPE